VGNDAVIQVDPRGLGPPCECSFYQQYCKKGYKYACLAYQVCKRLGNNKLCNCIRNYLISHYNKCQSFGCVAGDHAYCIATCARRVWRCEVQKLWMKEDQALVGTALAAQTGWQQ